MTGRYQWFYHAHAPENRPAGQEHIHLFARRSLWEAMPVSRSEQAFKQLCGNPSRDAQTRHLMAIGIDPNGLPISIFAVNCWVTGDLMLGADTTAQILAGIDLDTGHPDIDCMLVSLARLCGEETALLLAQRDKTLASHAADDVLEDRTIEILSETAIDLDKCIAGASRS